jgi:hypothetical protein
MPACCQREDADVETTAIHFRHAAAAEIEDLVASLRRKVSDRLTCVDIFGKDLRFLPLIDRKQELRRVLRGIQSPSILYADHIEGQGTELFRRVCEIDLEGSVAKHRYGNYRSDPEASTWFKIRNRSYSQWAGRNEAFERDRHSGTCCGLACVHVGSCCGLTETCHKRKAARPDLLPPRI